VELGALSGKNVVESPVKPPLIAIIDDDSAIRESVSSLLRSMDYRAALFDSAEAFLLANAIVDADCLLLDISLPGLSGLELQRSLGGRQCRIPIIFISGKVDQPTLRRALRQGAAAVLAKPFSDDMLLGVLEATLAPR
jgi:FixJ family two-component response regulator